MSVQARSALRMGVTVGQTSRLPGSTGRLQVVLTDSGVPLSRSARVHATITAPDGGVDVQALAEGDPGVYTTSVPTSMSGVHRILVRADGSDLRGTRFSREELRTLAVWARGDDPPPTVIDPGSVTGGGLDGCRLLACVLCDPGVRELLERSKVSPDRLARCVKDACARS